MIRISHIVVSVAVGIAAGMVFKTSHEVSTLESRLNALNSEIAREQEAIRVLKAEWAYLNRPERLRDLARAYSVLAPARGEQVVSSVADIPEPLRGPDIVPHYPRPATKPASPGGRPPAVAAAPDRDRSDDPIGTLLATYDEGGRQ